MYLKGFAILFSVFGVIATFLPWVVYPALNTEIYGYNGDGVITLIFCLIVFGLSLFQWLKRKSIMASMAISCILGGIIAYLGYGKIVNLETEINTYANPNSLVSAAVSGFYHGSGLYLLFSSGLGIFCISLIDIYQYYTNKDQHYQNSSTQVRRNLILPTLLSVGIVAYFITSTFHFDFKSKDQSALEPKIKEDINKMGSCMLKSDFDCFLSFSPPLLINAYGGKEKLQEVISHTINLQKQKGVIYQNIEFSKIDQIYSDGSQYQAIIHQDIHLSDKGIHQIEKQKLFAISYDDGDHWFYLNLTGMDINRIKQIIPNLNQSITF